MLKAGRNRARAAETFGESGQDGGGVGEEQRNSSAGGCKVVRWFGHVQRRDGGDSGQRVLKMELPGRRT